MQHSPARARVLVKLCAGLSAVLALASPAAAAIKVAVIGPQHVHSHQLNYPQEYPAMLQKVLGANYEVANFGDCCATILLGYPRQRETHAYLEGGESYPAVGGKNFKDSVKFMPDIVVMGPWGKHDTEIAKSLYGGKLDRAKFEESYQKLIQTYLDLPSKPRILAMTVVPIPFGMPTGVSTEVMEPAMKAVHEKMAVVGLDVYSKFLNKRELFKDETHVTNDAGLKIFVDTVAAGIMNLTPVSDAGTTPPVADAGAGGAAGTGGTPATGGVSGSTGGSTGTATGGSSAGTGGSSSGSGGVSATGGSPSGSGGSGSGGSGSSSTGGSSGSNTGGSSSAGGDEPAKTGCSYGGAPAPGAAIGIALAMIALARRRRR